MKHISYEPIIETRQTHYLKDILFALVVCGSILGGVYYATRDADAAQYAEDHSSTEAMITELAPSVDPALRSQIATSIDKECGEQGVPVALVVSLIARESGFRPDAVSKRLGGNCSYGLMQVNPGTAAHPRLLWQYSLYQLMEPEINIHEGVAILKAYLDRSSSVSEALGRYCGSQGMVEYKMTILSNTVRLMSKEV